VNYLEKTHHDESDNIIIHIYIVFCILVFDCVEPSRSGRRDTSPGGLFTTYSRCCGMTVRRGWGLLVGRSRVGVGGKRPEKKSSEKTQSDGRGKACPDTSYTLHAQTREHT